MSEDKTDKKTAVLETPAHGHGKLWRGAGPNQKPGSGRPASAVKEALRNAFDERISLLADIADGRVEYTARGTCQACGHEYEPGEDDLSVKEEIAAALKRGQVAGPGERTRALDVMAKHSDLDASRLPERGLLREFAQAVLDEYPEAEGWERIEATWLEALSRRF